MTYSYDETIELLQQAVTEKGDGHTAFCKYADEANGGQPVCIVGHVLSYVGLLHRAQEGWGVLAQPVILSQFTQPAIDALMKAQRTQDDNKTWGEALIAAKEVEP